VTFLAYSIDVADKLIQMTFGTESRRNQKTLRVLLRTISVQSCGLEIKWAG